MTPNERTHADRPSDASIAKAVAKAKDALLFADGVDARLHEAGILNDRDAYALGRDDAFDELARIARELDAAKPAQGARAAFVGSPAHVALWDAIAALVEASGGRNVVSAARMNAVPAVEQAIADIHNPAQAPERRAVTDEDVPAVAVALRDDGAHLRQLIDEGVRPDVLDGIADNMDDAAELLESLAGVPAAQPQIAANGLLEDVRALLNWHKERAAWTLTPDGVATTVWPSDHREFAATIERLIAAAQLAPDAAGEPVAFRTVDRTNGVVLRVWHGKPTANDWLGRDGGNYDIEPLYLHPASAASEADAWDAARYRWLREHASGGAGCAVWFEHDDGLLGESYTTNGVGFDNAVDELIDAALAAQQRKGG